MPEQDGKLTATKGLAEFVKLLPKTARALQPGEGFYGGTRGAGFWLAFTKSRAGVIVEAQVEKTEPAR